MKQTAVEKLVEEINKLTGLTISMDEPCVIQATQMEKEQMQMTWNNAIDAVQKDKWESYDDFYNNNFKSE